MNHHDTEKRTMKPIYRLLLVINILALLSLACSAESLFLSTYIESQEEALSQPAGTDETPVTFVIEPGQSVEVIANQLDFVA